MTETSAIVPYPGDRALTLLEQNVQQQFESLMSAMIQNAADMRNLFIQVAKEVLRNNACDRALVTEWLIETNATYSDLKRDEVAVENENAVRIAARAAAATSQSYERLTSVVEQLDGKRQAAISSAASSRLLQRSKLKRVAQLGRCQGTVSDNIRYAELWIADNDIASSLLRAFAATVDWVLLLREVDATLERLVQLENEGTTSAPDLKQFIRKAEETFTRADAIQARVHDAVLSLQTKYVQKDDQLGQRISNLATIERVATDVLFELQSELELAIGTTR